MADKELLSEQEIREQLERILQSSDFQAESLRRFLRFVVEETLAGRAHHIKAYTVAVHAFGRPSDFDPQSDTIVRVQARRLRRALRYYYATEGIRDPLLIEVPKGTYVPVFSRRDLAGHRTPVSSPSDLADGEVGTRAGTGGPSIVIFPFRTLADDLEQVYLADGLAQALVVAFSCCPGFTVIGPLSRSRLEKEGWRILSVAGEYGAGFALDGHLRTQDERVRLTVRLVEVRTGRTLWADTYDSLDVVGDLFAFEDAVVSQITSAVADHYGVIHRTLIRQALTKRSDRIEVYDAILRYYHYTAEYPAEARAPTFEALETATDMEPENSLVLSMLADMYIVDYLLGHEDVPLERPKALIGRALTADPQSAHALFVRADLRFFRGDRQGCIDDIERALQYGPYRPDLMSMSGALLAVMEQWERGIALMEEAYRLNPHLPSTYRAGLSIAWYLRGEYRAALEQASLVNAPAFFWKPLMQAAALGQLGLVDEGAAALRELVDLQPDFLSRGPELVRRWVFSSENVDSLLDGLRKAGLEFTPGRMTHRSP